MRHTISHGECGKSWNGVGRAHCAGCHETFNTDGGAEQHRKGPMSARRCVDPATLGFRLADGIWFQPAPEVELPFRTRA